MALKEFDEVRRIVKTEVEGNLLDHHVGVAQQAFRLEHEAGVDISSGECGEHSAT